MSRLLCGTNLCLVRGYLHHHATLKELDDGSACFCCLLRGRCLCEAVDREACCSRLLKV